MYKAIATNGVGCNSLAATYSLNVLSNTSDFNISSVPSGTVTSGEPVVFSTDVEAEEYDWSFTGGLSSDLEKPVIVFNLPDTIIDVELTVKTLQGCEFSTTEKTFIKVEDKNRIFTKQSAVEQSVDIKVNKSSVKLYPNPTEDGLVFLDVISIANEEISIIAYDMNKREIDSFSCDLETGNNTCSIDVGSGSGFYYLVINGDQFEAPVFVIGMKR